MQPNQKIPFPFWMQGNQSTKQSNYKQNMWWKRAVTTVSSRAARSPCCLPTVCSIHATKHCWLAENNLRAEHGREKAASIHDLLPRLQNMPDLNASEQALVQAIRQYDTSDLESVERVRDCCETLEYYQHAIEMEGQLLLQQQQRSNDDPLSTADIQYRIGKLYMKSNDLVNANKYYKLALDSYELLDNLSETVGHILVSMAGVQFHRNQHERALELLTDAQSYLPKTSIKVHEHQGLVYRSMQDFDAALQCYQTALTLEPHNVSLQLDVADMHMALEQFDEAKDLYERLLDDWNNSNNHNNSDDGDKDPSIPAILYHNLGKLHAQIHAPETARDYLEQSVQLKRLHGMHDLGKTLNVLGGVYALLQQNTRALQCFQESLVLLRQESSDDDEAQHTHPQILLCLRNIAVLTKQNDKNARVPEWTEGGAASTESGVERSTISNEKEEA